ncbi:unnamed protein product [Periconia digitata]|uniref:Oxidase ustYa n=1 Tax=Periconia digitata TaxID=1303443 RepID=A0A9W4ULS5_9PLEO|nr:unnamed protein product [Periconia digitata]
MPHERCSPSLTTLIYGTIGALFFFWVGRISMPLPTGTQEPHLSPIVRLIPRKFTYERLFGSPSSPQVDYTWLHLFPSYGGFFAHPHIAPKRSTFSVFHQLHCVNSIRRGYWIMHDAARSGEVFNETGLEMDASPAHIRHCIDLLRQAIMCNPDLTIEEKNLETGGVSGFGVVHQCYDWDQLVHWVKNFELDGLSDSSAGPVHVNGHMHGSDG